jgi:hypothetical protein
MGSKSVMRHFGGAHAPLAVDRDANTPPKTDRKGNERKMIVHERRESNGQMKKRSGEESVERKMKGRNMRDIKWKGRKGSKWK